MQADDYRGAARVFGHSFYSQGSREDAQASADSFLDRALQFFGDPDRSTSKPSLSYAKCECVPKLRNHGPKRTALEFSTTLSTT